MKKEEPKNETWTDQPIQTGIEIISPRGRQCTFEGPSRLLRKASRGGTNRAAWGEIEGRPCSGASTYSFGRWRPK